MLLKICGWGEEKEKDNWYKGWVRERVQMCAVEQTEESMDS